MALTVVLGSGSVVTSPSSADAAGAASSDDLDAFVDDQLERAGVPGAAWAVVGPDGVEHQGVAGVDGDGEPVTASTPFLWGSVAKPVTATLLVLMADAGEVDLDAAVTTYLPGFRMADPDARRITVRQLLDHTSGVPERLDLTDRYEQDRRPGDVLGELADVPLVDGVGAAHHYSSVNYLLLAAVVEEVTGRPFAEVLTDRVLGPAGMTSFVTTAEQARDRLPPGHRYVLGTPQPFTSGFDAAGVGYGYLGGTLADAVAFAGANLSGSSLLTDVQRAELVRGQVDTGPASTYGLGWRSSPVPGADARMVWHSGAAPGYQASVVLLPDQDRAVVVLQDVYGSFQEPGLLDTAWGLAALLSGGEPQQQDVDPLYVGILGGLGGICLVLLGLVVRAGVLLARPPVRRRRRRRTALVGWVAGSALVAAGLLAVPRAFGVPLLQLPLWAPDVAAAIGIGVVLAALLALARVAVTVRVAQSRP